MLATILTADLSCNRTEWEGRIGVENNGIKGAVIYGKINYIHKLLCKHKALQEAQICALKIHSFKNNIDRRFSRFAERASQYIYLSN